MRTPIKATKKRQVDRGKENMTVAGKNGISDCLLNGFGLGKGIWSILIDDEEDIDDEGEGVWVWNIGWVRDCEEKGRGESEATELGDETGDTIRGGGG
jgi:hypothetical protein